jgi:hypothetical protein
MQSKTWRLTLVSLLLAALGCSAVDNIVRPPDIGGSLGSVPDLWEDVPRMDSLTASDEDLPVFVRLLVRTVLRGLMGNGEGAGNWIMFATDQTPEHVQAFYTDERMSEYDWQGSGQQSCTTGSTQGIEQIGVLCLFQKQVGNTFNAVIILAAENEAATATNVVFIRIEADATPEAAP